MKLYTYAPSPNSLKARLALAELGLDYEAVTVDLSTGANGTPEFTALNPHRKVPVLVDGDLVLRESNAILTYLGRRRPTALWPDDRAREALAHQWMFFEAAHLAIQCGALWFYEKVAPAVGIPVVDKAVLESMRQAGARALRVLDGHLQDHSYVLGEFSLVDCCLGAAVSIITGTSVDDPELEAVRTYRQRIHERPSWQAAEGPAVLTFS